MAQVKKFNDLSDDCFMEVLEWLSPEELFKLQRLNQRMKRLAGIKMGVKIKAISLLSASLSGSFPKCSHLGTIRRDQILCLTRMMELLKINTQSVMNTVQVNGKPISADGKAFLLDVFVKFANIKSFDFGLPGDWYLEVFQRCPEIECIKLGRPVVKEADLNQVLDLFGHRLVHVWNDISGPSAEEAWLLATVAEKCPNIKQIDWQVNGHLTTDWMAAIKRLPKSCHVNIKCYSINDGVFEDVVDELEVVALPPVFIDRTDRLSKLRLTRLFRNIFNFEVIPTEFVNLKKLEISRNYDNYFVNSFVGVSQFPRLEEFCFSATHFWQEIDYEAMFASVSMVKLLTLVCKEYLKLPRSAIRWLEELDTIAFKIKIVPRSNQQAELLKKIEYYVKEVKSLKKLKKVIVEPMYQCYFYQNDENKWKQAFKDGIERLRWEQRRVKIEFQQEIASDEEND